MVKYTWNTYPDRAPDPRWADNWEDDPARDPKNIFNFRKSEPNKQRQLHLGLVGSGALLKRIIKENQGK